MNEKNILLTGKPGIGKTTVISDLYHRFAQFKIAGFYTQEIRRAGQREGFLITSFDGLEKTLAHMNYVSPHKVGKYGVNLSALSEVITHLQSEMQKPDLWMIDEIGKMESLSPEFRTFLEHCLQNSRPVVATISISAGGWIEKIRQRMDITLLTLNEKNRNELPETIAVILQRIILKR